MSAEKYPTLSSSLNVYVLLLKHVDKIALDPLAISNPSLRAGVQACKAKLLKFFDLSTYQSGYYYYATSMSACLLLLFRLING